MSFLYSRQFMSWQNLPIGQSVSLYAVAPPESLTVVIRTVSFYWGAPDVESGNSAVLLDLNANNGVPTIVAFDSGLTSSINPIYETFDGFWPLSPTPPSIGDVPVFQVANTTVHSASVDVYVGGWVLTGPSAGTFQIRQP